jgi:hypothetical protein
MEHFKRTKPSSLPRTKSTSPGTRRCRARQQFYAGKIYVEQPEFLWVILFVHLKHLVYNQPINSVKELTGRVVASCAQIREDREVFSRLRASIAWRAQVCITHQGHFQHLL